MSKIRDYYESKSTDPEIDISYHMPALRKFAAQGKAKNILELGVRKGNSTVALLLGAQENYSRVVSVDIERHDWPWYDPLEFQFHWEFHEQDDLMFLPTSVPIDLLFIDTSHEADHTRKELEHFEPYMKERGMILLHDTNNVTGVLEPARKWADKNGHTFLNDNHQNGLGIILL